MGIIVGKIVLLIAISAGLIYIQLWIVRTLFPNAKQKSTMFRSTLGMGAIVAGLLLLYTYGIQPHIPLRQTLFAEHSSTQNILYSIFIAIAGGLLGLLFARKKQRWGVFFIGTATILAIVTGAVEWLLAGSGIGVLLLRATGEEVLKSASSQSLASHVKVFQSDIIVMSILAGFGFALFENIVYFVESGSMGQFFVRALTTSLLHAIFTGSIGYVLWKHTVNSYVAYVYAYAIGIGLHMLYNLSMQYVPIVGGIVFIIGGYFLLSFLLYKSDRLYLE